MAKKSWTDRLNDRRPHEVKPAPIDFAAHVVQAGRP